jgi:hypothetical protein
LPSRGSENLPSTHLPQPTAAQIPKNPPGSKDRTASSWQGYDQGRFTRVGVGIGQHLFDTLLSRPVDLTTQVDARPVPPSGCQRGHPTLQPKGAILRNSTTLRRRSKPRPGFPPRPPARAGPPSIASWARLPRSPDHAASPPRGGLCSPSGQHGAVGRLPLFGMDDALAHK